MAKSERVSGPVLGPPPGRMVQLAAATQTLATAASQPTLITALLQAAVELLGASGATVLLATARQTLVSAGHLGETDGVRALKLTERGLGQVAHYCASAAEVLSAFPALEGQNSDGLPGRQPERVAVVPLVLAERCLGVLALEFRSARPFTPDERASLSLVCVPAALALGRLQARRPAVTDPVPEPGADAAPPDHAASQALALDAFVRLTEAVGTDTDLVVVLRHARDVLESSLPDTLATYFELEGGLWTLRLLSSEIPSDFRAVLRGGLKPETAGFADAVQRGQPIFIDHWNVLDRGVPHTETYRAAAFYPYFRQGQPLGMFVVGSQSESVWSAARQLVFGAVGRSLGLALERAEQVRASEGLPALRAFVALTEAVGAETDLRVLVGHALAVLQAHLSGTGIAYYNLHGDVWKASIVSDNIPPLLARALQAGVPVSAPPFAEAVRTRAAVFVNTWNAEDRGVAHSEQYGTGAFYPYFREGQPVGMFVGGDQSSEQWSEVGQAIFRAVGRSLGLALERSHDLRELERSNEALSAANEELEAFTYSASHDLRTPVRHALAFTELAGRAIAAGEAAKARQHLDVVQRAGQRMNSLIDSMLLLSRAGRQSLVPGWVSLAALVAQAQQDMTTDDPAAGTGAARPPCWELGPLPLVWGDASMVQQVITNLISNAVKYTRRAEAPLIRVWTEERAHDWLIQVQDNGVGFDPQYQDRLFGVFQRLHRADEFEGTGVGLATVRRIVQRHGGQVMASGQPGQGAAFGFTLPRPASPPDSAV